MNNPFNSQEEEALLAVTEYMGFNEYVRTMFSLSKVRDDISEDDYHMMQMQAVVTLYSTPTKEHANFSAKPSDALINRINEFIRSIN